MGVKKYSSIHKGSIDPAWGSGYMAHMARTLWHHGIMASWRHSVYMTEWDHNTKQKRDDHAYVKKTLNNTLTHCTAYSAQRDTPHITLKVCYALCACLPACLSACLPACLPVCLPACLLCPSLVMSKAKGKASPPKSLMIKAWCYLFECY